MATYDPMLVTFSFKGVLVSGYAGGTFITAEREVDVFSKDVGAGGNVTRVRSRNRSGSVKLTLQAAALSNTALSSILTSDELLGDGEGPIMMKDLNSDATLVTAEKAWIRGWPPTERAAEASSVEWVFDAEDLNILVGGFPS